MLVGGMIRVLYSYKMSYKLSLHYCHFVFYICPCLFAFQST